MGVVLDPQPESLIQQKVDAARYPDAAAVISEALRLLDERDRTQDFRAALHTGLSQIERGETVEYTPELLDRLAREAEQNARLGKPVKDAVTP